MPGVGEFGVGEGGTGDDDRPRTVHRARTLVGSYARESDPLTGSYAREAQTLVGEIHTGETYE